MGLQITDHIDVTNQDRDEYPTHLAYLGKGGFRSVQTLNDMNSITEPRREDGMFVYILNDGISSNNGLYQLINEVFVKTKFVLKNEKNLFTEVQIANKRLENGVNSIDFLTYQHFNLTPTGIITITGIDNTCITQSGVIHIEDVSTITGWDTKFTNIPIFEGIKARLTYYIHSETEIDLSLLYEG